MFVKNCWYAAAWRSEVTPDALLGKTLAGQSLVLYRKADGTTVAMEDRCPHRHAPLSLGRKEGDSLRCMYHGLRFEPDGKCIEVPGQPEIPPKACVRTYPVAESGPWTWVWIGEADKMDLALLPDGLIELEHSEWVVGHGELTYQANYQLVNDNLLDLGHLSYVHAKTLGRGSMQWGETRPRVQRLDRGVRVERWLTDHQPSAALRMPPGSKIDQWSSYDFLVPGLFVLRSDFFSTGTAKGFGMAKPTSAGANVGFTQQAVTPVDETSSIYRFTFGYRRSEDYEGRLAMQERILHTAFAEDKQILEAQQRVMARTAELPPMVLVTADLAATQFRRIMDSLARP